MPAAQFGDRRAVGGFFAFPAGQGRGRLPLGNDAQQRVFFPQLANDFVVLVAAGFGGSQPFVGIRKL
jgi:hypothetical protein